MENNISPELELMSKFVINTDYEDLPEEVIHEVKRLLLDSIGVAYTGLVVDSGKMAVAISKKMGGSPEASILGLGDKVSLFAAVHANGQLINATDYDAFVGMGHGAPYLIPLPLAVGEKAGASGKDLILSLAIACEIAKRVKKAVRPDRSFMLEREGYANMNFGAAAAAAKILGLDHIRMMNALSTAGHASQVLTWSHIRGSKRGFLPKYGLPGWQATGALMAVQLAEMGYAGDMNVFDPEHGFWKFAGYAEWAPEHITDDLGKEWTFVQIDAHDPMAVTYKLHICCKIFSGAIDALKDIVRKHDLSPEDIEEVKVSTPLGPLNWIGMFQNTVIENAVDAQFSVPFNVALAANRVPDGISWQETITMRDPKILDFMKKVVVVEGDEGGSRNKLEVKAKGQVFTEDRKEARGGAESKATDEELEKKFKDNAARVLIENKIDKAAKTIWDLENVEDINELVRLVTL